MKTLVLATRKSELAMWQAKFIATEIAKLVPEVKVKILGIETQGDINLTVPLSTVGGKELFIKELQQALLNNEVDMAIHSMKDVPTTQTIDKLVTKAVAKRASAKDVLISKQATTILTLPNNAVVGTSSIRRQTQIKQLRPDLILNNLRGNINSRIHKLLRGDFAAIVLAEAGITRLKLATKYANPIAIKHIVPAPAQGVLAVEYRRDDKFIDNFIAKLQDNDTAVTTGIERQIADMLDASCNTPIGIYAKINNNSLQVTCFIGDLSANNHILKTFETDLSQHDSFAAKVVEQLMQLKT